ncbi:MAG: hypothetical protein AAF682_31175 [Planctomycetota bacterium]
MCFAATLPVCTQGGAKEEALLVDPVPANGAAFGWAVDISGDAAIVGGYLDDPDGHQNAGAAYIFRRSDAGAWNPEDKLVATDAMADDNLGTAVAIWGDTAIVGAFSEEDPGSTITGSCYAFKRNSKGNWGEHAKFVAAGLADFDGFGWSADLWENTAVVGSWYFNINPGRAHVFLRQGDNWIEESELLPIGAVANSGFGMCVSVSGELAAVGAPGDSTTGFSNEGAVFVFKRVGASWVQQAKLTPPGSLVGVAFGRSVALAGERLIVGAYLDDDAAQDAGSAYVFEFEQETGSWLEEGKLLASDAGADDLFGFSVAIQGTHALVGAPGDDQPGGTNAGAAYVFGQCGGLWSQEDKFMGSALMAEARFGRSLAYESPLAIVGAPAIVNTGAFALGEGYAFELPFLCSSEAVRLGTPPNPMALLPGQSSGPLLGAAWDPVIDHSNFMPGAVLDFLGITAGPFNLPLISLGTLLCDPTILVSIEFTYPGSSFSIPIPSDCAFVGASVCTQGASLDGLGAILLTNAIDLTIGTQ